MRSKNSKTNPFEVFGLTPKLVKELDDQTLFKLIKALYRILQLYYHPDKGGDPKKALEINLAYQSLNLEKNEKLFKEYKNKYIQRLSRKTMFSRLQELETQNRKLTLLADLLKEKCWQLLVEGPMIIEEISRKKALKLKIFDLVSHLNFSYLKPSQKSLFFKEIYLIGSEVVKKDRFKRTCYRIKNYRFLGSIKRNYIEPWILLEKHTKDKEVIYNNLINREIFVQEFILFLRPELEANAYLFFFQPEDPQHVVFEGILIKKEEVDLEEVKSLLNKVPLLKEEFTENITDRSLKQD
ncbi:DnaJ family molecular chaperone [Thermodesulfobacterium sp.]|jgi:hypothetical protein|uniref:J domain-containing protein n=1 Tax=Thermodesulfobacterium sp. TaxID=1965289 RepID=UPI0026482F42|nr:hypothetical protein [Thermodesulfobacterium sp.]MDN5379918.1 hypothetical protein [Thermodesulfobacterium sp.]